MPDAKPTPSLWNSITLQSKKAARRSFEAPEDDGFFGPGSVTWKVWSHPTSYLLGFMRAVTIEHLDPNLAASVVQSGGVKARPHTRYARTIHYFAMTVFGATRPTAKAADVLVKVHSKAIGHDPVTGGTYDGNDGDSQLWIHVTAWHSILYCYEKYGPGKLSADEEQQFWAECARAAELQTIDPEKVPRSREEVRAYFESWRPRLAASEDAQDMVDFILQIDIALPPRTRRLTRELLRPLFWALRKGVIASYPRHIRKMFDLKQGPAMDLLARAVNKVLHLVMHRSFHVTRTLVQLMAPSAMPVLAPVVLDIPAQQPGTMTPREAQAKYGYAPPFEAHRDMREKQRNRVFGEHLKPSDEGLIESQQHIGGLQHTA